MLIIMDVDPRLNGPTSYSTLDTPVPLPNLTPPCLPSFRSTVNGYEGTGRSLSLKLIQQLREQGGRPSAASGAAAGAAADLATAGASGGGRTFREVVLQEPIRWALTVLPLSLSVCLTGCLSVCLSVNLLVVVA